MNETQITASGHAAVLQARSAHIYPSRSIFGSVAFDLARSLGRFVQIAASMEGNCANAVAGIFSFVLLLR